MRPRSAAVTVDIAIAVLNAALCIWRAVAAIRAGRLAAIFWVLIAYFAVFFLPVAATEEIVWRRGFLDEVITTRHDIIHKTLIYVLAFNVVMIAADVLVGRLLRPKSSAAPGWEIDAAQGSWRVVQSLLVAYWLFGGVWYLWQIRAESYTDYVEGASWAAVIFWASSPLIVLLAMQRRWLLAFTACLPFLYCAVHLAVRSFALLSLVPLLIVGFYQLVGRHGGRLLSGRLLRYVAVAGGILVGISIGISQFKNKLITLPDSYMPFGVAQVVTVTDRLGASTGFASIELYFWNYISPFVRLFGGTKPDIVDTPVIIARLLEGMPSDWPVFFHYPALIWSDAYLSFGWAGLALGPIWVLVIALWEVAMRRNQALLVLLLPFFSWHCYMLARGAIAVASVPVAYALYLAAIPMLLVLGGGLLRRTRDDGAVRDRRPVVAIRPPNLLD